MANPQTAAFTEAHGVRYHMPGGAVLLDADHTREQLSYLYELLRDFDGDITKLSQCEVCELPLHFDEEDNEQPHPCHLSPSRGECSWYQDEAHRLIMVYVTNPDAEGYTVALCVCGEVQVDVDLPEA